MPDTFSSGDIAAVAEAPASAAPPAAAPAPDVSAAAATQPTPSAAVSSASSAEPPPERWPDILESTRKKTRDEVEAQHAEARQHWELRQRDPVLAFVRDLQLLAAHPQHAPQVRSLLGRTLASRPQDAMPGPDIPTDQSNGQPVVYSAQQMQKLLEWKDRQFQRSLDERFGPIEQREKRAHAESQAASYSQSTLQALADKPGFLEHKQAIAERYAAIPIEDERTEGEKLRDAYLEVVGPKLTATARQEAVADLQRKGNATTINPQARSGSEPYDFKKTKDFTADDIAAVVRAKGVR